MTRIRLAMLCLDEAERLPAIAARLAELPALDSVTLLIDDRTSDDTEDVAEELWSALPGGGSCIPFHFTDFGQARNELLVAARDDLDPSDYLLLLDPDSLPDGDIPDELTAPAYSCDWRWGGESWPRVILLRVGALAEYEGAVHEVLRVFGPTEHLPGSWVDAVVSASPERLVWIEEMLRRDAAENPRSAFYLAQTLMDMGRRDEAFGWYLRRAAMGHGWVEETYLATYLAGCIIEPLDWQHAEALWRRAFAIRPTRPEPFYQLARAANARGDHSEALALASQGLRVGRSPDSLRVNRWIESEGLMGEFTRAADGMQQKHPTPLL